MMSMINESLYLKKNFFQGQFKQARIVDLFYNQSKTNGFFFEAGAYYTTREGYILFPPPLIYLNKFVTSFCFITILGGLLRGLSALSFQSLKDAWSNKIKLKASFQGTTACTLNSYCLGAIVTISLKNSFTQQKEKFLIRYLEIINVGTN